MFKTIAQILTVALITLVIFTLYGGFRIFGG